MFICVKIGGRLMVFVYFCSLLRQIKKMKKKMITLALAAISVMTAQAQQQLTVSVTNPSAAARTDQAVIIPPHAPIRR